MQCNIRELRIQKLMTQQDLVKEVNLPGFDVGMLSRIENGHCLPTPMAEEALKRALQATHDELWGSWKEIPVLKAETDTRDYDSDYDGELPFEEEELIACLREGRKNAKTRDMLRRELDISDRRLRKLIETAQAHGARIGNLTDGNGYFLITDPKEGSAYYAQENSRAMRILRKIEPLGRWLALMGEEI